VANEILLAEELRLNKLLTSIFMVLAISTLPLGRSLRSAEGGPPPVRSGAAKWTVMIYMNGKNDLEDAARWNFDQIRRVGSTDDVNVVVELGLLSWDHSYRARVTQGTTPGATGIPPAQGVVDLGKIDMGSRKTLSRFILESKRDYPANSYLIIIWDHGQGWRLELSQSQASSRKRADATLAANSPRTLVRASDNLDHRLSNSRSISRDDEFCTRLFDSDVQEVIESDPVDIIGFDACLMSMVETAYALRLGARWMIGSEELIPGYGWKYDDWLARLTKQPDLVARDVCQVIGDTYLKAYGKQFELTLSAVDLARVRSGQLVTAISRLADRLMEMLDGEGLAIIKAARADCAEYAPTFKRPGGWPIYQHIDLVRFCQQLIARSCGKDPELERLAGNVIYEVRLAVAFRWCGKDRCAGDPAGQRWGSNGLAIYFPPSKEVFLSDQADPKIKTGYEIDNVDHPVEFVHDRGIHWASFIQFFVNKVPK
jgi:Clostripain family